MINKLHNYLATYIPDFTINHSRNYSENRINSFQEFIIKEGGEMIQPYSSLDEKIYCIIPSTLSKKIVPIGFDKTQK